MGHVLFNLLLLAVHFLPKLSLFVVGCAAIVLIAGLVGWLFFQDAHKSEDAQTVNECLPP